MTIAQLIQVLETQKNLFGAETKVVLESDSPYLHQSDSKEVKTVIPFLSAEKETKLLLK